MVELVGVAEVAEMLGVSKQRASQLSNEAGFPVPVAILRATKVWRRIDIADYAKETRRTRKTRQLQLSLEEQSWKDVATALAVSIRNPDLCDVRASLRKFDKMMRRDRSQA